MAKTTLFEALAGYEDPQPDSLDAPAILSGDGATDDYLWSERTEAQFEAILAELDASVDRDPEFGRKMCDAFGVRPDPALLRARIEEAKAIVAASKNARLLGEPAGGTVPDLLGSGVPPASADLPELLGVPANFSETYVAGHVDPRYWEGKPPIDLQPTLARFEDDTPGGLIGWLIFNGAEALRVPRGSSFPFPEQFGRIPNARRFRRHGPADSFVYELQASGGDERTRIALFADFGTGLGHARFIARQLTVDRFEAAVHLGDVYYTGTPEQYRNHFEQPLMPVKGSGTELFVVPDNHDGYSGFHAFCDFIDAHTKQGGSYFAIVTKHAQFIGVDTIWHGDRGRVQDDGVRSWLADRLAAGREAKLANVLMTGHHPYEYGSDKLQALNEDVSSLANGRIDLWFWGNTHYGALFDRTDATPYYGSCIGHAGYPYKRQKKHAEPNVAPVLFIETGNRYEGTDVRTSRGMNGFCAVEIEPSGSIELCYLDWRGKERHRARFAKQANGSLRKAPV